MPYRRIDIPQDLLDRLNQNKRDYGVTMQEFIVRAVRAELDALEAAKAFNEQWRAERARQLSDPTIPKS